MSVIHGGVRFVPARAGIINLWDYRDQEFCFADGRLVLRGPNGSGKTKALEVLFPFVLDGRIEPRRLNPFAGEERTMKSNLLYRKQDSAYSYVWMEFARGRRDDPEVVTVGIGMRATRSSDKVTRWYFVADGRVGVDFSLLGPDDRPLTRKQLAEEIGADSIVDRPVDYRAAIDARMFGLGVQRYDQLINLILTLRRPQLAKNLDPRGLSQALTGGLRPLDDQLVLDAARSFSDMEEVGRTLTGLVHADTATRAFVDVYRRYLAVQARTEVEQVGARLDAVTHASTALFAATELRRRREAERAAAEARADDADRAYEQARTDREALQRSGAYEGKQQLDDLADAVRRLESSAAVHRDKAVAAQKTVDQRAQEAERTHAAVRESVEALTLAEDSTRAAAEEAGINWAAPEHARGEALTAAVRARAEERDADLRATRAARTRLDAARAERERAERLTHRTTTARDTATAELARAEADVELARTRHAAALRDWQAEHRELYAPLGPGLVDALTSASADSGATTSPAELLAERTAPLSEELRERRLAARARAVAAESVLADLTAESDRLRGEFDCSPTPATDPAADVPGRTGFPLWRLIQFGDNVTEESAAGIEAALEAAGILDARVGATRPGADATDRTRPPGTAMADVTGQPTAATADVTAPSDREDPDSARQSGIGQPGPVAADRSGRPGEHTRPGTSAAGAQSLVPLPPERRPATRTLADVLRVERDCADLGVDPEVVADLLASVALLEGGETSEHTATTEPDHTALTVDTNGGYRHGVRLGRAGKARAEYIGAAARARRRQDRLTELDAETTTVREQARQAREEMARAEAGLAELTAAAKAMPRTTAVTTALRAVAEAAGGLRSGAEAATQAERELDQAVAEVTAQEKKLRAIAAEHATPCEAAELDALAAAIRHFENTGAGLARLRLEHERALEREREGVDRYDEAVALAEAFAEEAEAARAGLEEQQRKLATLRDALGAGAAEIDAELERAAQRIDACRAAQKSARTAANAAIAAVGDAEAAYRTAHEALGTALTEVLAQARALAPYAQPDLLALLGADPGLRWPSSPAAWSTPEQVLYRIAQAGPDGTAQILPVEAAELFEALSTATNRVRAGEAARKSTRSAVTAALQEFDAALAASGRDYRLRWDAADGLTVVQVQDEHGLCPLADFAARVASARSDQELLLTDSERRILEDALLTGLAQQIHERTGDARDLIAKMGAEMKKRRMSSGNTIGVHWLLADDLSDSARAMCKLLDRETAALEPADLAAIRAHFAAEIRAARAAHPERSYPEILAATLDYRRWRVFSFTLIGADGSEDKLTVARHSALSGGEQSVSLHLPLFAAAHVMLDSADPQAPRLLALDEAFAGVDDNGRSELLGLSVQFDLDLFMTGYDLWITYPHVPGCAHYDLAHSAAEHTVSATLLVWDSGDLLAEHDGTDLTTALGSPDRRRVPAGIDGGLPLDDMPGTPATVS
ncbi:SbcC/MukB-like Walker B domain-containing protein [Nocardia shimofusensis]|uniref:SbcC/MukB-like Walker B domain-containing protein n=1 Tax=Nocardia shimofusensis TaxID=228596 RepID=UPI00082BC099|nr:SbcC/MukB-like Walker B domain-containing protein [Nocardia shimofusensis]